MSRVPALREVREVPLPHADHLLVVSEECSGGELRFAPAIPRINEDTFLRPERGVVPSVPGGAQEGGRRPRTPPPAAPVTHVEGCLCLRCRIRDLLDRARQAIPKEVILVDPEGRPRLAMRIKGLR